MSLWSTSVGKVKCGPWLLQLFQSIERCGWGFIKEKSLWPANNNIFIFLAGTESLLLNVNLDQIWQKCWEIYDGRRPLQICDRYLGNGNGNGEISRSRDRKSSGQWNMKFTFTSPISGQNNFNGRSSVSNCLLTWTTGPLAGYLMDTHVSCIYSFHIGFFSCSRLLRCLFLWLINLLPECERISLSVLTLLFLVK